MSREQELELIRKVGLMGLKDLRQIAPIGNIGYENDWAYYSSFAKSVLPRAIMKAFRQQSKRYGFTVTTRSCGRCITESYCPELGLRWGVDSSD